MQELYPSIDPYQTGMLSVSDLHTLYFEQVGNPDGKPILFLHGGPGGGCYPFHRRYFDPQKWRIVLFDQRGCGRSTPDAELEDNTTWDLVNDIEKLRSHLEIERWAVFGGSWGSTLALAYSQTHADRCVALILRGIFMMRPKELRWFYQEGANYLFPDAWEDYLKPIPPEERQDLIAAYYQRLISPDPAVRQAAAQAWSVWEGRTSRLSPDPALEQRFGQGRFAEAVDRIEGHYCVNNGFCQQEDQLLQNIDRIRHIPAVLVQGRYDVVCPPLSAWELHKAWTEADLVLVPNAGHSATEPGIRSALLGATDQFARL